MKDGCLKDVVTLAFKNRATSITDEVNILGCTDPGCVGDGAVQNAQFSKVGLQHLCCEPFF